MKGELERNVVIIGEYKQICNSLSGKVEKWTTFKRKYEARNKKLNLCEKCEEANKLEATDESTNENNDIANLSSSCSTSSASLTNETNNDQSDSLPNDDLSLLAPDSNDVTSSENNDSTNTAQAQVQN
jgi:hypothetical protein